MISQNFIWVALAISVFGNLAYVRDTLKGETKPNRVTFFLWGAAPLVAFFAQKSGGASIQILYTLTLALLSFAILAASFVDKKAYWAIGKFDVLCGTMSLIAIILLIFTGNALLALALSLLGDFFAALPTIIKSYKFPQTETAIAYTAEIASSIIILLTIHNWVFLNYCFAAYILATSLLFTALLVIPRKTSNAK
jgi:hypothetical protein